MSEKISTAMGELKKAIQGGKESDALLQTEDSHTEVKFSVSPKDFLKFMEKAISGVTQKVLGAFKSDIQQDFVKQNDKLLSKLEKLVVQGKMEITNPEAIKSRKVLVENLDDLRPPVINFPKKIASEITNIVRTLDLEPETTNFERDPVGRVRSITENYSDFTIVTSFKRDRNEQIIQINTQVK